MTLPDDECFLVYKHCRYLIEGEPSIDNQSIETEEKESHFSENWMELTNRDLWLLAAFMAVTAIAGWWFGSLGYEQMRLFFERNL